MIDVQSPLQASTFLTNRLVTMSTEHRIHLVFHTSNGYPVISRLRRAGEKKTPPATLTVREMRFNFHVYLVMKRRLNINRAGVCPRKPTTFSFSKSRGIEPRQPSMTKSTACTQKRSHLPSVHPFPMAVQIYGGRRQSEERKKVFNLRQLEINREK